MIRVDQFLAAIQKPFDVKSDQTFKLTMPIRFGKIKTVFERQKQHDIRAEIETKLIYNKSSFIMKTYSDDNCTIHLTSKDLSPNTKVALSLTLDDQFPGSFMVRYHTNIASYSFSQVGLITSTPSNMPKFPLDFRLTTQVYNASHSLRVDAFHDVHIFSIESFLYNPFTIGGSFIYNWDKGKVVDAQIVSQFDVKDAKIASIGSFLTRSLKFIASYPINKKISAALSISSENIGIGTDFVAKLATTTRIKKTAHLKSIIGTNKICYNQLEFKYQDFLKMQFFSSVSFNDIKSINSSFGTKISFDLTGHF